MIIGHVESPLDREPPLPAEVPLVPSLRLSRHERHEIIAFTDLTPDLLIPRLATAQIAFVLPDLKAKNNERILQESRRLAILGRIAKKDRRSRRMRVRGSRSGNSEKPPLAMIDILAQAAVPDSNMAIRGIDAVGIQKRPANPDGRIRIL